jgi:hypothetical protein
MNTDYPLKFRQLPCKTFVSIGACPYRDRCKFLHDPRIIAQDSRSRIRSKTREEKTTDSLFWPVMTLEQITMCVDTYNQPNAVQEYMVPPILCNKHDEAVYSLWMHFVEFCQRTRIAERSSRPRKMMLLITDYDACEIINKYTNKKRLSIFIELSLGF